MNKKDLIIGFLIGLAVAFLGFSLFIFFFTEARSLADLKLIRQQGYLGKLITLGAVFNLAVFFILLKLNKDFMARGVLLATIILALLTVIL